MKRKPGEDFEVYKKRRKAEAKAVKERLKGRVVWNSSNIIPKPGGSIGEFVKATFKGTYIRGRNKLENCQSDKNRFDRLKKKAERKMRGQNET